MFENDKITSIIQYNDDTTYEEHDYVHSDYQLKGDYITSNVGNFCSEIHHLYEEYLLEKSR